MIEKLAQLAAPLANQAEHNHITVDVTGDLREQGGLATAGPRKQANALAFTQGQQAVDRTHPGGQCAVDPRPLGGQRRLAQHQAGIVGVRLDKGTGPLPRNRAAKAVQHLAQQVIANPHPMRNPQLLDTGTHAHAFQVAQGTEHRILLIETDNLGQHVVARGLFHLAQIANTRVGQAALQQHAVDPLNTPTYRDRRKIGQGL